MYVYMNVRIHVCTYVYMYLYVCTEVIRKVSIVYAYLPRIIKTVTLRMCSDFLYQLRSHRRHFVEFVLRLCLLLALNMFKTFEGAADCEIRPVIRFLSARNVLPSEIHHQIRRRPHSVRRVCKNLCPATISASIMAVNMW